MYIYGITGLMSAGRCSFAIVVRRVVMYNYTVDRKAGDV